MVVASLGVHPLTSCSLERLLPRPPLAESRQNLIGPRLVYVMALRSPTRRALLPGINEQIQQLLPGAPPISEMTLSRIANGQRHVRDYELIAISRALDVDVEWLIGERPGESLFGLLEEG